jgi:MerR family transcriptional regulator, redox-sensitive transcriptional activator SoxR
MDLLTVKQVAERSGFAPSALRFYEQQGLIGAERTSGNQRRYPRSVLRRLAYIAAARHLGLSLEEIKSSLEKLPGARTPTRSDWARLSAGWRDRLEAEIDALTQLRDGLDKCIGCGCLSLDTCSISNPGDYVGRSGPGARFLAPALRPADEPARTSRGRGKS